VNPYGVSGVALVTGGGKGIGRATAVALGAAGADVCVVDIDATAGQDADKEVTTGGRRGEFVQADLSEIGSLDDLVTQATERLGPIDILVNNAGIVSLDSLLDVSEQTWRRVLDINLTSPWKLSQIVALRMIERAVQGHIVNVSSSSAFRALGTNGAYGISKAGIAALTRSMAGELGTHGINVNGVAPGVTATPMATLMGDMDVLQAAVMTGPQANLLQRVSMPEDVANAIVFLCSPASRQITGQIVHTSAGGIVFAG
jgi:NAD(P)-dependent dehydrogenase (short-subunit alcohol dehydrogenase family)